jgi:TPP-dependent indolepyruvate ferredoxin oxidoreductase alpha subunit
MNRLMLAIRVKVGITKRVNMQDVTDLTPLYNKYKGQWVALKDDEVSVITHGQKAKDVLSAAEKKGFSDPILFKVPADIVSYIG